MNHVAVEQFWSLYEKLPLAIQKSADNSFMTIKQHPNHPLLRLVRNDNLVSMRIGSRCRAIGVEEGETTVWFWIGTYKQFSNFYK